MPGVANTEKERKHLSKKEFLYIALDTLSEQGQSQLHLHALIELMPVTSGSFYHHFKNKRDFLRQVIRYWEENGMQSVIDEVNREVGGQAVLGRQY